MCFALDSVCKSCVELCAMCSVCAECFRVCLVLVCGCSVVAKPAWHCAAMQGCVCGIHICIYVYIWILMYIWVYECIQMYI